MRDDTKALIWFTFALVFVFVFTLGIPMWRRRSHTTNNGHHTGGPMTWIAQKVVWLLGFQLELAFRLFKALGVDTVALSDVLNNFKSWGTGWKDRALAAEAQNATLTDGLTAAQAALAAKAQELADVLANDATEDAIQIDQAKADQAQADADAAQAVLDEVTNADLPPAPPEEPPSENPPVIDPVPDPTDQEPGTPVEVDPGPPAEPETPAEPPAEETPSQ